jgi:hypothetical protein
MNKEINEDDVNMNLKKPISTDKPDKSHQTSITCTNSEDYEQTKLKKQIWRRKSGETKLKTQIWRRKYEDANLEKQIWRRKSEDASLKKQIWRHKSE